MFFDVLLKIINGYHYFYLCMKFSRYTARYVGKCNFNPKDCWKLVFNQAFDWNYKRLSRDETSFARERTYVLIRSYQILQSDSGDEGIRTPDPLLARQVLSQLSYTPVGSYLL